MLEFIRRNHYVLRKLHSLTGVVPVGGFLIFHLLANASALRGEEAYNRVVEFNTNLPGAWFIEYFLIFLPILFHAAYGVVIALDAKHNLAKYQYARNWMFYFQRVSGLVTLVFLGYHIWSLSLQRILFGTHITFDMVFGKLQSPWIFLFYIVGLLSAVFHFANGLWSFAITWGITVGPRSQRVVGYLATGVFLALSALGILTLFAFRSTVLAAG